ncbi:hypothetical protein TREES_T100003961 [Tupaia chinensis]|uniref:Uncharacterized protein n=1 Tax=Tupaia chinensis TaxID=246437 RepID=L9KY27_TUPCH|nr:hypothetical protein TREES_T100003961 [Tupaia chinensis]
MSSERAPRLAGSSLQIRPTPVRALALLPRPPSYHVAPLFAPHTCHVAARQKLCTQGAQDPGEAEWGPHDFLPLEPLLCEVILLSNSGAEFPMERRGLFGSIDDTFDLTHSQALWAEGVDHARGLQAQVSSLKWD